MFAAINDLRSVAAKIVDGSVPDNLSTAEVHNLNRNPNDTRGRGLDRCKEIFMNCT